MRSQSQPRSPIAKLGHYAVLAVPMAVLAMLAVELKTTLLAIATGMAILMVFLFARLPSAWRPPTSGPVLLYYLTVLTLVIWCTRSVGDSTAALARGALFLGSVLLLAAHDLFRTGAEPRRRARKWCARLQARQSWPADLKETRHLSEVYALQDAAQIEPGPVFDLFRDPRPEVRAAAFAAFIGRRAWRPREAAAVFETAKRTKEPAVRVLALAALASIDDPVITQSLAEFFNDPSPEVRAAAVWAALSDNGARWAIVRDAIRGLLCDPRGVDQALPGSAGVLPVVAICDLTAWAGEPEPLGNRCVRTLIDHYGYQLQTTGDYDLITDLTNQVLDTATPTVLRVELAGLLRNLALLTPELLDRLSNADQPGPVRLLAAEAMLAHDPYHPDGLDVLRGLGRQPNREMAVTIAGILQSRLGLDMELPSQGLVLSSKAAGEVAKRVMAWAVSRGGDRRLHTPEPGSHQPLIPMTQSSPDDDAHNLDLPAALPALTGTRPRPWR